MGKAFSKFHRSKLYAFDVSFCMIAVVAQQTTRLIGIMAMVCVYFFGFNLSKWLLTNSTRIPLNFEQFMGYLKGKPLLFSAISFLKFFASLTIPIGELICLMFRRLMSFFISLFDFRPLVISLPSFNNFRFSIIPGSSQPSRFTLFNSHRLFCFAHMSKVAHNS